MFWGVLALIGSCTTALSFFTIDDGSSGQLNASSSSKNTVSGGNLK